MQALESGAAFRDPSRPQRKRQPRKRTFFLRDPRFMAGYFDALSKTRNNFDSIFRSSNYFEALSLSSLCCMNKFL